MIVHNGSTEYDLTPPHDVLGKRVGDNLPKGEGSEFITDMMRKSYDILKDHPVNKARVARGLNPANSLWIWGQGKKPQLSSFYDKYHITGTAISAVDLIKGIAICAGLNSVDVEGATGTLRTNYKGKAEAAIREFRDGKDFVYMHLEGPDECSHQGDMEGKIQCMRDLYRLVRCAVLVHRAGKTDLLLRRHEQKQHQISRQNHNGKSPEEIAVFPKPVFLLIHFSFSPSSFLFILSQGSKALG